MSKWDEMRAEIINDRWPCLFCDFVADNVADFTAHQEAENKALKEYIDGRMEYWAKLIDEGRL